MVHHLSPEKRKKVMSSIRSRDTKPELLLWEEVNHRSLRRYQKISGKTYIGKKSRKIALFVDGCFWHGCPICYRPSKTRTEYWSNKLKCTVSNDERFNNALRIAGFKVLKFWEHEVLKDAGAYVQKINEVLV